MFGKILTTLEAQWVLLQDIFDTIIDAIALSQYVGTFNLCSRRSAVINVIGIILF